MSTPNKAGGAAGGGKVMPLSEAVARFVAPGDHLHLGYGGGRPNAAVAEIIRQFSGRAPGFRVSAHGFVSTQHALLETGLVDRLTVAFAGENFPSPRPNRALQRALSSGSVRIENWSIWTLTARLMAGSLGVPFLPVNSLAGSSMAVDNLGNGYGEATLEGGGTTPVVTALRPDLVLLQGLAADPAGNVLLAPPYGEAAWGALAAKTGVIACVERVVDGDLIRAHNTLPTVPAHTVRAVCLTPKGSHPYGIHNGGLEEIEGHVEDAAFMADFRAASRDPHLCKEWIERWILGVPDHGAYLERLGAERLAALRSAPTAARPEAEPPSPRPTAEPTPGRTAPPAPVTTEERMTLAAARLVGERVVSAGHDIVLAGIGYAHLAAWTVVSRLQREGVEVQLAAELGMSGFQPQPGDPYLFAARNFPSCVALTDVLDVLGRDISGPAASSIGVLGAGQVDRSGNLNSTYSTDGRFIVGSGGANDVASAADEVIAVVNHAPDRLVESLPYVTAPGRNVSYIVTSSAVLERRGDRFVAIRYLDGGAGREDALRELKASTGWDLDVAEDCSVEPPPSDEDLARLRGYDPGRIFLGRPAGSPHAPRGTA